MHDGSLVRSDNIIDPPFVFEHTTAPAATHRLYSHASSTLSIQ